MSTSGGKGATVTPASTVTGPDAYGAAAAVGTGTDYARNDHDHGLPASPAVPTAATTVTGPDAYGAAAAVGVGTHFSREDHNHGLPASPAVPAPGTTVTGPDAYGAAAVVGVSTDYSRKDHDHGLPAAPSPALSFLSGHISADQAITAVEAIFMFTGNLTPGTWVIELHGLAAWVSATVQWEGRAAVNSGAMTLEGSLSYAGTCSSTNPIAFGASITAVVTATGQISFSIKGNGTGSSVKAATPTNAYGNATGYTAVRIA